MTHDASNVILSKGISECHEKQHMFQSANPARIAVGEKLSVTYTSQHQAILRAKSYLAAFIAFEVTPQVLKVNTYHCVHWSLFERSGLDEFT